MNLSADSKINRINYIHIVLIEIESNQSVPVHKCDQRSVGKISGNSYSTRNEDVGSIRSGRIRAIIILLSFQCSKKAFSLLVLRIPFKRYSVFNIITICIILCFVDYYDFGSSFKFIHGILFAILMLVRIIVLFFTKYRGIYNWWQKDAETMSTLSKCWFTIDQITQITCYGNIIVRYLIPFQQPLL